MIPAPFRFSPEDIGDTKLGQSLAPLLDALNLSMNDVVSILQGQVGADNLADKLTTLTLAIDTMDAAFPLKFSTKVVKPSFVSMVCVPKDPDHSNVEPRVMQGFSLTDSGQVSIPFITGLLEQNSYVLTFLVR